MLALALLAGMPPAAGAATISLNPGNDLQTVIRGAASGDIISLTADYTYRRGLEIDGKNITFALNGHNLSIANDTGAGLSGIGLLVHGGSKVDYTGAGSFKVSFASATTNGLALDVEDKHSSCTLTGVQLDAAGGGNAIYSDLHASVTVHGNVSAQGAGNRGVFAQGGSTVTVNGHVTAASGHGVDAENAGTSITVNGNVSVLSGHHLDAIYGDSGASVTVNGNVSAGGSAGSVIWGIEAHDGATIAVTGGMTIADGGIYAERGAKITVGGPVNAKFTAETPAGVDAEDGATILLGSNLTVTTAGPGYAGAAAHNGSAVTIDGTLAATPNYIDINSTILTAADITSPTAKSGYDTYTDGNATVWVKATANGNENGNSHPPPHRGGARDNGRRGR